MTRSTTLAYIEAGVCYTPNLSVVWLLQGNQDCPKDDADFQATTIRVLPSAARRTVGIYRSAEVLKMTMLVVTGVLHRKSNLTVMMMKIRPHPDSSMVVVVMLLLLLVLLGTQHPLPLSAAGQQHKVVRVAGVLTQDPHVQDDDEP